MEKKMKITRGIDVNFAEAFKECELYNLYVSHKNELFIGVRNNYLNLYYNCDSIAKIEYKNHSIRCVIDKYYLDGKHYRGKEKMVPVEPKEICERYETIKIHSCRKAAKEKKAQSKLVLLNNTNKKSNWFCIDIEYIKQFRNQVEKNEADFNGRFDVIALSKDIPHKVAFIELKYGSHAMGGNSGIYKHISDFSKFCEKEYFESHLKQEIIDIIKSQKDLGLCVPFELSDEEKLLCPEFYFITLNNNAETKDASTPKQTMAGYLFKEKRWNCKRLTTGKCVEKDFGDVTNKDNKYHTTFLFSTETIENLNINNIIDDDKYERI
jgi:hypothetical protein